MKALSIIDINSKKPAHSLATAISFNGNYRSSGGHTRKLVLCKCQCGKEFTTSIGKVVLGHTLSCGCLNIQKIKDRRTKYKNNVVPIYHVYHSMIQRCYEPKSASYRNYGERGVIVCEEWRNNYQSFLDWALQSGYKKGLQLDKDKKGDGLLYSPGTCCWLTKSENNKDKRTFRRYELNGKQLTVSEISKELNITVFAFYKRVREGKTGDKLLKCKIAAGIAEEEIYSQ